MQVWEGINLSHNYELSKNMHVDNIVFAEVASYTGEHSYTVSLFFYNYPKQGVVKSFISTNEISTAFFNIYMNMCPLMNCRTATTTAS